MLSDCYCAQNHKMCWLGPQLYAQYQARLRLANFAVLYCGLHGAVCIFLHHPNSPLTLQAMIILVIWTFCHIAVLPRFACNIVTERTKKKYGIMQHPGARIKTLAPSIFAEIAEGMIEDQQRQLVRGSSTPTRGHLLLRPAGGLSWHLGNLLVPSLQTDRRSRRTKLW